MFQVVTDQRLSGIGAVSRRSPHAGRIHEPSAQLDCADVTESR